MTDADDPTLGRWRAMTDGEREALARRIAGQLPAGFVFTGIERFGGGGGVVPVARYALGGEAFSLVPGGEVRLGFDVSRWEPAAEEVESWQETAEAYGIADTIEVHVARVTRRPTTVRLRPLLVAARAVEPGWQAVPADDPAVREAVRRYLRPSVGARQVVVPGGAAQLRVRREADGRIVAERCGPLTHADVAAGLAARGLRLPTSDEWEHACGGGTRSLYRWGDHAPTDRYPAGGAEAEAGSSGERPGAFPVGWDLHRRPNAFGLHIAEDPYHCELVAEADRLRGGDGGVAICGGTGWFAGWLPLATAYVEEDTCARDPAELIAAGHTLARAVLAL